MADKEQTEWATQKHKTDRRKKTKNMNPDKTGL